MFWWTDSAEANSLEPRPQCTLLEVYGELVELAEISDIFAFPARRSCGQLAILTE